MVIDTYVVPMATFTMVCHATVFYGNGDHANDIHVKSHILAIKTVTMVI